MSRKNFKVATANNGETPKQNIKHIYASVKKDKTPTGKVKTLKSAEERKKAHEEQYRTFRINALKRRAARMKLPDEEIEKLVEKLLKQLDAQKEYNILLLFTDKEYDLIKEALKNSKIDYKILTDVYGWINGDSSTLAKLREILPVEVKIHPYAKKMEPILKTTAAPSTKKPTNNTAEAKTAAKAARKSANNLRKKQHKEYMKFRKRCSLAALSKQERRKKKAETKALKSRFKASKGSSSVTVRMYGKKRSKSFKTRSTGLKQAA